MGDCISTFPRSQCSTLEQFEQGTPPYRPSSCSPALTGMRTHHPHPETVTPSTLWPTTSSSRAFVVEGATTGIDTSGLFSGYLIRHNLIQRNLRDGLDLTSRSQKHVDSCGSPPFAAMAAHTSRH